MAGQVTLNRGLYSRVNFLLEMVLMVVPKTPGQCGTAGLPTSLLSFTAKDDKELGTICNVVSVRKFITSANTGLVILQNTAYQKLRAVCVCRRVISFVEQMDLVFGRTLQFCNFSLGLSVGSFTLPKLS